MDESPAGLNGPVGSEVMSNRGYWRHEALRHVLRGFSEDRIFSQKYHFFLDLDGERS